MQFDSVAAALAMEGHGAYVWAVALVTLVVVVVLLWWPIQARRQVLRELADGTLRSESTGASSPSVRIEEVNNASSS